MDFNTIIAAISTVGFPIVLCYGKQTGILNQLMRLRLKIL